MNFRSSWSRMGRQTFAPDCPARKRRAPSSQPYLALRTGRGKMCLAQAVSSSFFPRVFFSSRHLQRHCFCFQRCLTGPPVGGDPERSDPGLGRDGGTVEARFPQAGRLHGGPGLEGTATPCAHCATVDRFCSFCSEQLFWIMRRKAF